MNTRAGTRWHCHLGVIVGPVVADLKYLTSKEIRLPLSRARISPKTRGSSFRVQM
jgi:hypothetical protein